MTERQRVQRLEEVVIDLTKAMSLLEREISELKKKKKRRVKKETV